MPTVFLSSTVLDFQDLRGALQDWLESKGFAVVSSELNDFDKSGDSNSYDACFKAVAKADYFVLLIGDRRGGLYETAPEPVSITRQEYRVAYGESKTRPLSIHTFVRKSTWSAKHLLEKKRLKKIKANEELSHQVSFLREVGQVEAMKAALTNGSARPHNNWITQFDSFRDIRSALEVNLDLRHDVETQALCSAIQAELDFVFSGLLHKVRPGSCYWPSDAARRVTRPNDIALDSLGGTMVVPKREVGRLLLATLKSRSLIDVSELPALHRATYWHRFADHDPMSGITRISVMQSDLREVLLLLRKLQTTAKEMVDTRSYLATVLERSRDLANEAGIDVSMMHAIAVLGYCDDLDRLQRGLVALGNRFVLGREYVHLPDDDIPKSPIASQEEGLREEEVTPDDVRQYLTELLIPNPSKVPAPKA